jgi:hypothetical protein
MTAAWRMASDSWNSWWLEGSMRSTNRLECSLAPEPVHRATPMMVSFEKPAFGIFRSDTSTELASRRPASHASSERVVASGSRPDGAAIRCTRW